jgi:hypothetical protein
MELIMKDFPEFMKNIKNHVGLVLDADKVRRYLWLQA